MITRIQGFYDWIDSLRVRDTYSHGVIGIAILGALVHTGIKITDADARRLLRQTIILNQHPIPVLSPATIFQVDWAIATFSQFELIASPIYLTSREVYQWIERGKTILALTQNLGGEDTICLLLIDPLARIIIVGDQSLNWLTVEKGMHARLKQLSGANTLVITHHSQYS